MGGYEEARSPGQPGLRERKKVRTRAAIARAALELFDERGFRATTIPEIAERADVSPRTVSSYFPAKEELLWPERRATFDDLQQRLAERRPGETAIDALRAWIESKLDELEQGAADRAVRHRIVEVDPGLQAYARALLGDLQELVAAAIAEDLGCESDDLEPQVAAAATAAVLDLLGRRDDLASSSAVGAWRSRDEALELVDRAMRFVSAGIAALRAPQAAP